MRELFRTNNQVLISWARALAAAEGVELYVLDQHMSVLEGSTNAIARRVMVDDRDYGRARTLIEAARADLGLAADLRWSDDARDGTP